MPYAQLDNTDKKILNAMFDLKETRYTAVAKRLKMTPAAVQKRVKKMIEKGVFLGTAPILNLKKIGFGITAIINVSVLKGKFVEEAERWARKRSTCSVYRITGDYDLVVVGKFKDMDELNEFTVAMNREGWVAKTNTGITFQIVQESVNPNVIY
ncbi:Lrp/AsnC family transcriptional regulator [Candidatus Micrarchaeota archaeon]|nr:Lrp/AsnC family transcriptional regulator [Candidatus Micrarchaeota archaeon]MBU1939386.1 Lrp/AsnC family transcriptional regulator [Candidatus Micrarchaeota archaeon]